jgi:hypothetical protein
LDDDAIDLTKLAPALVALQADLKPVAKTATNPFFKSKYAPLTEVMESVQPLLAKHKLAVSQFVTHLNGASALRTILIHESGQLLQDIQPLLLVKQDPQGQGSAITYARRYGLMAVLGLVADEDDDGNAASRPAPAKEAATEPSEDQLTKAKRTIYAALETAGYEAAVQKKAFVTKVLGHSTIETLDEADSVMDAIENEAI